MLFFFLITSFQKYSLKFIADALFIFYEYSFQRRLSIEEVSNIVTHNGWLNNVIIKLSYDME